jgi:hypothetical protein
LGEVQPVGRIFIAYRSTGTSPGGAVWRWAEKHDWREGTEGSGMNKLFCAMTWAELYLLAPDAKKIEPTLHWLATDAPNSPGGGKIWFGHVPVNH